MKDIRWRIILIVAVIGLSIWSFYPPDKKINLGLDLKGGVHLVLRVHTDDALRLHTELTSERVRGALSTAKAGGTVNATGPTEMRVEGVTDQQALRAVE